jgi:hypothetical protein
VWGGVGADIQHRLSANPKVVSVVMTL